MPTLQRAWVFWFILGWSRGWTRMNAHQTKTERKKRIMKMKNGKMESGNFRKEQNRNLLKRVNQRDEYFARFLTVALKSLGRSDVSIISEQFGWVKVS